MHTSETIKPELSSFKVEITIEKLKRCTSPSIRQILAELMPSSRYTLLSEIHKIINCIWNKEEPPHVGIYHVPIYKTATKLTVVIIERYHCCQRHTKFDRMFFPQGELHM
jgi:hypothetical protein